MTSCKYVLNIAVARRPERGAKKTGALVGGEAVEPALDIVVQGLHWRLASIYRDHTHRGRSGPPDNPHAKDSSCQLAREAYSRFEKSFSHIRTGRIRLRSR
jgi:hypothetical protein